MEHLNQGLQPSQNKEAGKERLMCHVELIDCEELLLRNGYKQLKSF